MTGKASVLSSCRATEASLVIWASLNRRTVLARTTWVELKSPKVPKLNFTRNSHLIRGRGHRSEMVVTESSLSLSASPATSSLGPPKPMQATSDRAGYKANLIRLSQLSRNIEGNIRAASVRVSMRHIRWRHGRPTDHSRVFAISICNRCEEPEQRRSPGLCITEWLEIYF